MQVFNGCYFVSLMSNSIHLPVLVETIFEHLALGNIVVDGTMGGGGHTLEF